MTKKIKILFIDDERDFLTIMGERLKSWGYDVLGSDSGEDGLKKLKYEKGCPKCMNTGYRGRTGVFELMTIDSKIRDLILARASLEDIKKHAVECGMGPLKQDGVRKVRDGVTTIDEVLRVLQRE